MLLLINLGVILMKGLSENEVLDQRKTFGYNEFVTNKSDSKLLQILKILADPMGLMLLGLGTLYFVLGNKKDSFILFASYIPVTAVDVVLELRAKKALKALSKTLKQNVKVIRNSIILEINIRELVPNDLIVFEEGQSLPADGEILECDQLQINEAALTGESIPIDKKLKDVFLCGTTILKGRGVGTVLTIGEKTRFGKISKLLEESKSESSPLEVKINGIIKKVLLAAIVLALFLFVITLLKENNWTSSLIQSVTFGMAAIPEEFPLVFTLYLSLGAFRLSKHGVLVKSLPSVETLGNVDVLCTDKTGTLTEGKFQLETIETIDTPFKIEEVWQIALMSCEVKAIDAMEVAIVEKGNQYSKQLDNFVLKWDYPFENIGKHMSHVWLNSKEDKTVMAMKGSIEGVLEHCLIDEEKKKKINLRIDFWAQKGKRILGLAGKFGSCTGDRSQDEKNLEFIGLCIFSDPIRNSAKAAISECQKAGIEVKMLTGDHPITAHAIADELNLTHDHEAMFTGSQLIAMSSIDRRHAFIKGAIFSRVLPEQKYEMVEVLKKEGKVVAMTGDGINDAPALKIADIGISMGENASDVARSSAKMILMKNDFNGIVEALLEGRRVFSNLKRSFSYLISFHIPIIAFAFFPPVLGFGNILLPIHVVLLELVVHPISAFSFENLPALNQKSDKSLMTKKRFIESFISGLLVSIGSLILYYFYLNRSDLIHARSIAMTTLLFGNLFFVFTETYPIKSKRFVFSCIGLVTFTLGILYLPILSEIFYLKPISITQLLICFIVAGFSCLPVFIEMFYLK
jgi:Ca2+-transporting ATPase